MMEMRKKKINKISVTRLQLPVSLWTQPREESAKEVKNETQRSKFNFLMYTGKDDYPTFQCDNK